MKDLSPRVLENSRLSREDILADGPLVRSKPQSIHMDVSNRCNIQCIMCPYHWNGQDQLKAGSVMPKEIFYRIGRELFPTARNVYLFGGGEVFFHPHWDEMFDFARQWTFLPVISTHGGLFTDRRVRALVEAGTQLRISFDGATRETFNRIRYGADFDRVVANIRRIVKYRDRHVPGGRFFLRFSVTSFDENVRELPQIVELASELGVEQVVFHHLMTDRNPLEGHQLHYMPELSDEMFSWAAKRGAELGVRVEVPQLFDLHGEAAERLHAAAANNPTNRHAAYFNYPIGPSEGYTCRVPWVETYVKTDGRIMPCCVISQDFTLGNVASGSFEEVWNGTPYQDLRRTVNSMEPPATCTTEACTYRNHKLNQGLIRLDGRQRPRLDSRCPGKLRAAIRPLAVDFRGSDLRARIAVTNEGDTLWLADQPDVDSYGRVRLGLKALDRAGEVLADFSRVILERDVAPGEAVELAVRAQLPPGASAFLLDMVDECVAWFELYGSATLHLRPAEGSSV